MKYCSKCGQANDDNSQHCSKCGASLNGGNNDKPITVINKNSYHWDPIRIVLAILLIGIMIAAFAIEG